MAIAGASAWDADIFITFTSPGEKPLAGPGGTRSCHIVLIGGDWNMAGL